MKNRSKLDTLNPTEEKALLHSALTLALFLIFFKKIKGTVYPRLTLENS